MSLNRFRLWLRSNFLRTRLEREMRDEMTSHVDKAIERYMARGMSRDEARIEALREFGNVTYLQEQSRDARGWQWLDALRGDFRFAIRHFGKRPITTITMVAVLGVGMAVSTALFAFVYSYATMPPPGIDPADNLVRIRGVAQYEYDEGSRNFREAELRQLLTLKEFESAAGWSDLGLSISAHDGTTLHQVTAFGIFVTENYFRVLGVDAPTLKSGTFTAVITENMWRRLFAKRRDIVGQTFQVNGVPVTIAGVAPGRFTGVDPSGEFGQFKLFLPMSAFAVFAPDIRPDWDAYQAVARLRAGVTMEEASAAVRNVSAQAARVDPRVRDSDVAPIKLGNSGPDSQNELPLLVGVFGLLGGLVLLITCTNVSAVLTGLGIARRREIAVRLSMGAGRGRIVRQLVTESVLLALSAATIGLLLVWILESVFARLLNDIPVPLEVTAPVQIFAFTVAIIAGTLFGLSPALHATRVSVATVLKESAATIAAANVGLQKKLVVAQIALTQPLIVAVLALLAIIFGEYRVGNNRFADNVIVLRMAPAPAIGAPLPAGKSLDNRRTAMTRFREAIKRSPGVVAVGEQLHDYVNLNGFTVHANDRVAGGGKMPEYLNGFVISPGYLEAEGIPVERGRDFKLGDKPFPENADTATVPIVMDKRLAQHLWPGIDPIGRRLQRRGHTLVVTAITDHVRIDREENAIFLPVDSARHGTSLGTLIRTSGPGKAMFPMLRTLVEQELPRQSIRDLQTMAEMEMQTRRGFLLAFGALVGAGSIALFIAAVGLYAVVSFSVNQRIGEIAVRVTHGAQRHQIVLRFIGSGLRLSALGAAIGLPLAMIGVFLLSAMPDMPEIPITPVLVAAVLGGVLVSVAATWAPAQRAAGVDPVVALRAQ